MSSSDNKRLMQDVFTDMARGNLQPFFDAMAEDMRWTWMGTGRWSHTFEGRDAVVDGLFSAVRETLSESFEVTPHRFIAEGDFVVVEHSGRNATPDGRPYDNRYCWVCSFADGKLRELREYMDTQLVTETFGGPDETRTR
jgi:uncharacterized protein